jgi:hypothetical protein
MIPIPFLSSKVRKNKKDSQVEGSTEEMLSGFRDDVTKAVLLGLIQYKYLTSEQAEEFYKNLVWSSNSKG